MYTVNNSVFDIWMMLLFGGHRVLCGKGPTRRPAPSGIGPRPENGGRLPSIADDLARGLRNILRSAHFAGISPGDGPFSGSSPFSSHVQAAEERGCVRQTSGVRVNRKDAVRPDIHLCAETFRKRRSYAEIIVSHPDLFFSSSWRCRVQAAEFPSKEVQIIIPWAAGGATDLIFRALAATAGKYLGKAVVVVNRPGGGGAWDIRKACRQDPTATR